MVNPKLYIYFLAVLVIQILQACLSSYPQPAPRLVNLPTPSHNNKVELFFANEVPKEEYIKVMALEVEGGINDNLTNLIKSLEQKAQMEGMDAVFVLDKIEGNHVVAARSSYYSDKLALDLATNEKSKREQNDLIQNRIASGDYQSRLQGYSKLSGIGIKYKKNINYLHNYLKAQHIYNSNDTTRPILSVYFDIHGEERSYVEYLPKSKNSYLNQIRKFSPEYLLLRETAEWRYRQDGFNVLRKRTMYEGENVALSCKPQYTEDFKLKGLMIKEAYANFYKYYKMELQYANRQIVKTKLTIKGADLEQREFNYLPSGLCSRQSIYKMNNQRKELDKVVKYEYYTQADVDSLVLK